MAKKNYKTRAMLIVENENLVKQLSNVKIPSKAIRATPVGTAAAITEATKEKDAKILILENSLKQSKDANTKLGELQKKSQIDLARFKREVKAANANLDEVQQELDTNNEEYRIKIITMNREKSAVDRRLATAKLASSAFDDNLKAANREISSLRNKLKNSESLSETFRKDLASRRATATSIGNKFTSFSYLNWFQRVYCASSKKRFKDYFQDRLN